MTRPHIPDEILSAAHERSRARAELDWVEADRLRAVIEEAGWRVVDRGVDFRLLPAIPPDAEADGVTNHGSSASVPSRLSEPSDRPVSVILLVDDGAGVAATMAGLTGTGLTDVGTFTAQMIVVASEATVLTPNEPVEIVRMVAATTIAERLNAGMRRATGAIIVVLSGTTRVQGDVLRPLERALDDPAVAVAGAWGSRTDDLRSFSPVEDDPDVLDLECLAFRRADAIAIGPVDERFQDPFRLGAWLSLALRVGSAAPDAATVHALRAARVVAVPVERAVEGAAARSSESADDNVRKIARRDFYRLRDAFGPIVAEAARRRA